MGKQIDIEIEQEVKQPKNEIPKVGKRGNQIKKPSKVAPKLATTSMQIETGKDRLKKSINKTIDNASKRPTRKTHTAYTPAARPDFKPETMKDFDKVYEASMSEQINVATAKMSKGQKERYLKKQKLNKKHLFKDYLNKLKDKNKKSALMDMDLMKNILAGMEVDLKKSIEQKIEETRKGVSSKVKNTVANEECLRTQKILEHASFVNNPIDTVRTHLLNSIQLKNAQREKLAQEIKKPGKKEKMTIEK